MQGTKHRKRRKYNKGNKLKILLANNIVSNLSNYNLDADEISVLNKGLKFSPSKPRYQLDVLEADFKNFNRRLQLTHYFSLQGRKFNENRCTTFMPQSDWLPECTDKHIDAFTSELFSHTVDLVKKPLHHHNLNEAEWLALKRLKNNKEIIIKPADKGGGIAVLNRNDYISKIDSMLNDQKVYERVYTDDTQLIKNEADQLIHQCSKYLSKKQIRYLTEFEPRTPIFYGLPKLHKQNWPLRPVVSQTNGPTSRLNEYADKLLEVAEKHVVDLLKDSTGFLNHLQIDNHISDDEVIVTADVESLYTNIPHEEGVEFVIHQYVKTLKHWPKGPNYLKPLPVYLLRKILEFILKNCTFEFNGRLFKQLFGITMGASVSVKMANIYMGEWRRRFLSVYAGLLPCKMPRLIDDLFFTWHRANGDLEEFKLFLNTRHSSIKFTFESSESTVHFLDLDIYKVNQKLLTRVYTKPTDKKQFLHFLSHHPRHVKRSIPYSQMVRFRRNCSDDHELRLQLDVLQQWFLLRQYPTTILEEARRKISDLDRQQTLRTKSETEKIDIRLNKLRGKLFLPLIVTFSPNLESKEFRILLKKLFFDLTLKSGLLNLTFGNQMPQIIFKRSSTIKDYIIRAKTSKSKQESELIYNLATLMAENENSGY